MSVRRSCASFFDQDAAVDGDAAKKKIERALRGSIFRAQIVGTFSSSCEGAHTRGAESRQPFRVWTARKCC